MKTETTFQNQESTESRAARAWRLLGFFVPKPGEKPAPPGKKKVLIVDDDPIILKTTSNRLQRAGHLVTTATDGSEAIAAVREDRPDVILLDINFPPDVANGGAPRWDGFRLMYWLRGLQLTEGTRYVFISGTDSEEYKERANSSGALAFLPKPIDHNRLLEVISTNAKEFPDCPQPRRWWAAFFELL